MDKKELGKRMGGRILESYYGYAHVSNLVYEALDFGMESIQVFPNQIAYVKKQLDGLKTDLGVCAVIAYPHGTFTPRQKAFEIADAIQEGADQLEFVIHTINARSGKWDALREEFRACREAAGERVLKAIVEVEFLADETLKHVCELAIEEGIDRLSTSIGVYPKTVDGKEELIGVRADDIRRMRDYCAGRMKIVAMGNVDSAEKCETLIAAGADYICSEYAANILKSC